MAQLQMTAKTVFAELLSAFKFFIRELRPKEGNPFSAFNVISGAIILGGLATTAYRMVYGLGSVGIDHQEYPWGIWIGFNVIVGVAFAAGAYVITFVVYLQRSKKYLPVVRTTVLNGLLAYMFYAGALLLDLGRPWNAPNPLLGRGFGVSSVLFLVAWHFMLYMVCQAVEFSPVLAEWLKWPKVRRWCHRLTVGAVIFGITLSTLHQAGLGALFLMAKAKVHPLWYSPNIAILFFVSSIFAGLSMIIIESSLTNRVFYKRAGQKRLASHDQLVVGLGKGAVFVMLAYLFLKVIDLIHEGTIPLLNTGWGKLYLVEMLGFVLLPMLMFIIGIRRFSVGLVKWAALIAVLGIVLNRLNTVLITFKWYLPHRFIPSWQEVLMSLMILCIHMWVFRWVINRMPVMSDEGVSPHGRNATG